MSKDILKEIAIHKKELEEQVQRKARIEGKLESSYKTLKDKFNCSSLKEAKEKVKEMDKEFKELSEELETGLKEWESKYDKKD